MITRWSMRMCRGLLVVGLATMAGGAMVYADGLEITGPTIVAPATQPVATAPAATTTAPGVVLTPTATAPSAQAIIDKLLESKTPTAGTPVLPATNSNPLAVPAVAAVAPNPTATTRLREGQFIWSRVGRLVKVEKTGEWVFAFESDGKEMKDPPMGLLPCKMLEAMQNSSDDGKKSVRFRVSGQVTEYQGKNYLMVTYMQTVRDLNQF